jgi:cytochrome c
MRQCGRRIRAGKQHAVSQSNADRRPTLSLLHAPKCVSWVVACLVIAPLLGCTELDKYWDRSPTAPRVQGEVPPPPGVTIAFPPDGQRVAATGTLILSATAMDGGHAIAADKITWLSSRDGTIGAGPYLRVRGLSVGAHVLTVSAVNASGTTGTASVAVEILAKPTYSFSTDIYSGILLPRCYACHYPAANDWPTHHLDLRSYAGLMAGGDSRAYESIVPCRPESSLVWNKLTADPPWVGAPMPAAPNPKLPATLLDKLRIWILEGAPQ